MQRYLVCLLILIHLISPLPIHDYDYNHTNGFTDGKTTISDELMAAISTDVDDEDDDEDEEEENENSFTTSADGGIGVMGEVINNGETGTGGVVRTEKQTTQEEVQAVTEAVVTTIDNVATKKSMAEDRFTTAAEVQTGGGTKPTSNQASEVEEVENQITEDRTTADMSEVETMTTVAEEGEYTAEEHSVEGETVGDVVEEKTETTSDTRTDTGAVGGEEGGTTDGLTKSPMTAVAAEEGYRAEKYPLEEELTEDAVGHTMEAPILTDMEPTGATMTTAAEEEPFKTDEFSMEAITTEEKAEEGTETSTVADVELTDVLGMGGSATDYGVSATDAVGDEVIATTDDISDALVRKDDMAAMGMEENYISDTYPAEAETTKEVVKVTTEFPALTDEELTDAAITTAAEEEPYTMKKGTETPAGTGETTEEVGEGTTEAPVATAIELMNARTTGFGMTDTTEEEVWANTDDEKEETTEAESTVEGGLYPEGVDPMTTIVSEEDHTTGVYPVEAETTKEFVEVTTELPVLTDLGLTDATVTTAAEGEPYTTEKGIETSADMDAELVDAINMGSSATDYGVSTTDAVGDEVTAVTEDLSGALVKKDAMTTMGAERDYATEAYPLEEETTEGVFESTTEAPVATAIELMGATTTESGMTDATEEEVKTTPDGEKEETTEAESTVKGGLYTEGVDPMTTMVSEEDHTTAAYTLEEETTKEFVEVTTEAPVLTDTELIDATMTTAAEEEPYTTEKGTETSADKDAMLTDALIVEDPATDHGVSTTDAVGDEVTATTDHLSDMLVKKGDMTTMGAEEGSTTDAYPLEDKTTENGVEDTTEAPVATDIELMDTTTIESGMTGAIEEEVWATPDGEKEETTEAESTVKGGLYSEGVDPMTTIVSDEDHATGGYPLEEETNEGVVEITTEAPVSTNMEFTNAVDVKGLTSGAIEGELGITTAGLTVALATKANVNERTAENMDLQDSGSHSENVKTMTTVAEEEIYTMKAYPLEVATTVEVVEATPTTTSTAVGLCDTAVPDNSTASFVVDTTDAVSEVAGATDDIAESLVRKGVDVDNVGVENQPTETTSPSGCDTSPARLDAITTMNKEEELAPTTETTAKVEVEWTTETIPMNKLLDHRVFTGLWPLDDRTEKGDGTETFTTIDTGEFSDSDVRTSQVVEAVMKATGTEATTVAEGVTPTEAQPLTTTQETSLNTLRQELNGPKTSTVAGREDVANTGGNPEGLTTRPNDNEQGKASEFVTARTAAGPEVDSSKSNPLGTGASLTSKGMSEGAIPIAVFEEKPSNDVIVAAASVEVTTSGASSIRSVLSFALIPLFSHLLLSV